jgi:Bacteriophage tail sheath protein
MPVTVSYPGVYLEELPSAVRTITGVATSIAAFVGQAARGPINTPVTITSYADFERIFGGLWISSRLGYAVNDFYQNGGSTAVIVRIAHSDAAQAAIALPGGPPTLLAASPGAWGNNLAAVVDNQVSAAIAAQFGLQSTDLFNLSVRDSATGPIEVYRNLTIKDSPRRIDKVLPVESTLVQVTGALTNVPTANAAPAAGKTVWTDPNAHTAATAGSGNDGSALVENDFVGPGLDVAKQGLYALAKVDLFNLLCIPPYTGAGFIDVDSDLIGKAATYCETRRAMLLVDPPSSWTTIAQAQAGVGSLGTSSANAAVFFPRIMKSDPLHNNALDTYVPCGAIAGIFARTDAQRGVWKAPAGIDATLVGVPQLSVGMTDLENGELNPLGINCLRSFPAAGRVVWGSRTLQGDDRLASQWKYIPIRRLTLFLEESLYRGTQWVVFEPNDAPLWAQIRLNIGAFMQTLFRQGAFQGNSPQQAYFVKCDSETTTPTDQNNGIVNIVVGFAPLKPAEFVIIKIQQMAAPASQ